jgi:hypothetical protein
MRKSGWTPSIVPNEHDQNVYLVVDDLGKNGRVWREANVEDTGLEALSSIYWRGNISTPPASSHSTPQRIGRKMYQAT